MAKGRGMTQTSQLLDSGNKQAKMIFPEDRRLRVPIFRDEESLSDYPAAILDRSNCTQPELCGTSGIGPAP